MHQRRSHNTTAASMKLNCAFGTGLLKDKVVDPVWILNVMDMRENTEGSYALFCDHVLSHVVGQEVWKCRSHTHMISQIATKSDEAFALFLLENSWEVWMALAASEDKIPLPKYSTRGPGTKKFQGWTESGIKRFNELFDDVEDNRKVSNGDFDNEFKTAKMEKMLRGKKRR